MSDHTLCLEGIIEGEAQWHLQCNHWAGPKRPDSWAAGDEPCWLQTWWENTGPKLLTIDHDIRCFPVEVEPIGWSFEGFGENCKVASGMPPPTSADVIGTIGPPPTARWQAWKAWCCEWTDFLRPSSDAPDPRVAAQLILKEADWCSLLDNMEGDPMLHAGLVSLLDQTCGNYGGKRTWNSLHAWVTAHMRPASWCNNLNHFDEHWEHWTFGDCQTLGDRWMFGDGVGGDDDPCDWQQGWMLDADPDEFLTYATHLFRRELA